MSKLMGENMKRRDFMKTSLGSMVASSILNSLQSASGSFKKMTTQLPQRPYNDNVNLSIIGFGGIVVVGMTQQEANAVVTSSYERGVNYFDVAPSYWDGEAEEKLGRALQSFRKNIFLACKTMERSAQGAENELHTSLKRIGTDYFDLYQFHAVTDMEEVEEIFADGGALETFVKAKSEGKIRHIGFSAHSERAALAMLDRFQFDSILFPINFVCYYQGKFGPRVIQKAKEKGTARLALKMLAYHPWPEGAEKKYAKCWYQPIEQQELALKALRFTLSEDITAAIPPGEEKFYLMALELAPQFTPLSAEEREEIERLTRNVPPLFHS
jgi:aryl-alcohol dehydrogenase-like predicted oxidoreductase